MKRTEPEPYECYHGIQGGSFCWEWNEAKGTEEDAEPVILAAPPDCHECNCSDPFCKQCDLDLD